MDFIKNLFKDEEKIIGLCGFKKKAPKVYTFSADFRRNVFVYNTNTKNNFLLS